MIAPKKSELCFMGIVNYGPAYSFSWLLIGVVAFVVVANRLGGAHDISSRSFPSPTHNTVSRSPRPPPATTRSKTGTTPTRTATKAGSLGATSW